MYGMNYQQSVHASSVNMFKNKVCRIRAGTLLSRII